MRRIHRATDKESLIKALTEGDQPCFREIFRVLIFSSMLGRKLGRREPLEKVDSGKSVPEAYFSNSPVWPGLLYLIGIAETSSPAVLQSTEDAEEELATIFEEYANGGLSFLAERFENREVNTVSLAELITELTVVAKQRPNLSDIGI
jgi:dnd system-associated protein 4